MNVTPQTTLEEAKVWLRAQLNKGARCPCCNQRAQVYRWSLYSTAVRALALYHRLGGTSRFVHSNELKRFGHKGQGDASRLAHWGLLQEEKVRRPDGGRAGYWCVTEQGEAFLEGRLTIPKYAWVYDGRVLNFSGDPVSIHDVKGPFDLRELSS